MPSNDSGWQKFFYSTWFLAAAFLVIAVLVFSFGRAYYQDYQVRQEIQKLQEAARNLEAKKIQSLELLQYVRSSSFVEEKARTDLNMSKPGEQVAIILKDKPNSGGGQEENKVLELSNLNNPIKWWNYFFAININ